MSAQAKSGPLVGMRVLDLSHVMAGPVCGLMLADMGADVIKVENTEIGDTSRQMRTPSIEGESAAFMMMNRNKRGLAVDLKQPAGPGGAEAPGAQRRRADRELSQGHHGEAGRRLRRARQGQSRPHLLRDLGLRPHRPARQPGRLRSRRAGHVGPHVDHRRGPRPAAGQESARRSPTSPAGLLAAMGVAAAYAHKLKTGAGPARRHLAVRGRHHPDLLAVGHRLRDRRLAGTAGLRPPSERALPGLRDQRRLDHLGASNQKIWSAFLAVLDAPEIAEDARFADNAGRMANLPAWSPLLTPHFRRRTTGAVAGHAGEGRRAGRAGAVGAGDARASRRRKARDMVPVVEHSVVGKVQTIGPAGEVLGNARRGRQRRADARATFARHAGRGRL